MNNRDSGKMPIGKIVEDTRQSRIHEKNLLRRICFFEAG